MLWKPEVILSKTFDPGHGLESCGIIFIAVTEISVTRPARLLIGNTLEFLRRKERRHLGKRASPLTRLARLPDEFCCPLNHNQNGGTLTCIVRDYCNFVDSCNFTDNSILLKRKYMWDKKSTFWGPMLGKRSYFVKKVSSRSPEPRVLVVLISIWEDFLSWFPRIRSQKPRSR